MTQGRLTVAKDGLRNGIKFEVPGKPFGKQRPRAFGVKKFTKMYTPKETVNYETLVKELFIVAYPGWTPLTGPLSMTITAYFPIPKSYSKKKRVQCIAFERQPEKVPDVDNIAKVVSDALNAIAYVDDKQIVSLDVSKWYSDRPRVEIEIVKVTRQEEQLI